MAFEPLVFAFLPGGISRDITAAVDGSADWTTNAVGGFGSFTASLPGYPGEWMRKLPKLTLIRVLCGDTIAWEGQVEDHELSIDSQGQVSTTLQAFGLARLLGEKSVHRIWSKRDLAWETRALSEVTPDPGISNSIGSFDAADLTRIGLLFVGNGTVTTAATKFTGNRYRTRPGLTLTRVMFTYDKAGSANLHAYVGSRVDAGAVTTHLDSTVNVTGSTQDFALIASCNEVVMEAYSSVAAALTTADFVKFYNIRVLGTSVTEDAAGGFYGGSILRDLLALVPGLTLGSIADGSDFTIEALERSVRDNALSVVQEVAAYYQREYAVWENGRFDWTDIRLDDVNWVVDLSALSGLNLRSSADGLSSTDYVLYTDAASGLDAEASTTSISRNNPYVVAGRAKDVMTSAGFPMTSNTATQLSARLNTEHGQYAFASGTCTLPCTAPVTSGNGGMFPAYLMRGGDNVKIVGLPKDDPFNIGRDGQTLFHISSTSVNLAGEMTLALDSESHAIDSLLAKLAAVTRTLTG